MLCHLKISARDEDCGTEVMKASPSAMHVSKSSTYKKSVLTEVVQERKRGYAFVLVFDSVSQSSYPLLHSISKRQPIIRQTIDALEATHSAITEGSLVWLDDLTMELLDQSMCHKTYTRLSTILNSTAGTIMSRQHNSSIEKQVLIFADVQQELLPTQVLAELEFIADTTVTVIPESWNSRENLRLSVLHRKPGGKLQTEVKIAKFPRLALGVPLGCS